MLSFLTPDLKSMLQHRTSYNTGNYSLWVTPTSAGTLQDEATVLLIIHLRIKYFLLVMIIVHCFHNFGVHVCKIKFHVSPLEGAELACFA
jgi:hypothetical protein